MITPRMVRLMVLVMVLVMVRLMVLVMVRLMVLVMVRLMVLVMVGGVNTSVQCVDLLLEVIPGPQWTTASGSIYIRTATCYGRLWTSGSGDTTHALR